MISMATKHYDSYGFLDRVVYEGEPMGLMPNPFGLRGPEHRYIIWVKDTPRSGHGYRKTYRTKFFAKRRAQLLQEYGYGVEIRDRKILPGDTGFLANHDNSYLMTDEGDLHVGPFEEIQRMRSGKNSRV